MYSRDTHWTSSSVLHAHQHNINVKLRDGFCDFIVEIKNIINSPDVEKNAL